MAKIEESTGPYQGGDFYHEGNSPEKHASPALRKEIPLSEFRYDPLQLKTEWLLLCAGEYASGHFNAMTISWGSYGQIWDRMFFQVVVRPTRYTYEFMERYDTFTLSAFTPEKYRKALSLLGSRSGRESDKISLAGLTPVPSYRVAAPSFAEAYLVIECRKIYWQDLDPSHFLDPAIEENYPRRDYHRIYFGEILVVSQGALR